ncbi:MAG: guanylate kinase [Epsilonproteobacteria bacterium]|nr:guanylate kinase [Campylobacterota bacterium]
MSSIVVLSGPSGSGKTSIVKEVCQRLGSERTYFSISTTTRPPRDGEQNGVDYYFVSKDEFLEDIANDEFLEWAEVHGNYYGTSLKPIKQALQEDKIVFLDIDVQGFDSIKKIYPDIITSVFVTTPNKEILIQRLQKRGTETQESLKVRLINALNEMKRIGDYDYLLINDVFEESVEMLEAIAKVSLLKSNKPDLNTFIKEWNK